MHCEDLDLSKSGEISQFSEDLSEIRFSISRIFISNFDTLQMIPGGQQSSSRSPDSAAVELKLKFYSTLSKCKLKQKITRVSICKNTPISKNSCILVLQKDEINLKVSFPTHQEYEIFGKVYMRNQSQNLLGTFQINLLEWTKEIRSQREEQSSQSNLLNTNVLRKVQLKISDPQKTKFAKNSTQKLHYESDRKESQESERILNSPIAPCNGQPNSLQNYIEFKILEAENVQKVLNNYSFENIQSLVSKQKRLKIVNSIIDENISKTSKVPYLTTRRSNFSILPEKQVLKNLNRTKSQSLLRALSQQKLQQSIFKPVVEEPIKRQPKTFKEKIYELLQEVRHFKMDVKNERLILEKKAPLSRIKNLYFLMSSKRENHMFLNVVSEKIQKDEKNPENRDSMVQLSSIIKAFDSEAVLSVCQNDQESTLSLNAKYQQVDRIEKRLESFEKIKKLSRKNLFKAQEIGETSQNPLKAES